MLFAALDRVDVANYVDALFNVFLILIITRVILGWIQMFRPIPYIVPLRATIGFVEESVDPYLNVFRRWIPPIGGPGMGLDLSPVIGILLLVILQGPIVNAIAG
ncbi:MAG TPA: YggT family protein [Solirubrobacterales bacterium]|nr:YggT family protein [Solirubrobacterales bacterium]